jgi:23S rRNA pseudouridine1911/1915/1917 synthase
MLLMPRETDMPLDIIFQDDHYVALNKPAGLAAIPGRGEATSALHLLAEQLGLPCSGSVDPRLRVVHRIDKDTSGILLFAKNLPAQRHLSFQFQNNAVEKEYLALVSGRPEQLEGRIEASMAVHPANSKRMIVSKRGRPALTLWRVETPFRDFALLRVFPKTGKTHQIRVHLSHIGLPLAVDELYHPPADGGPAGVFLSSFKRGYRKSATFERPLTARLTLHAQRLVFNRLDGRRIELQSPIPKDLRATLNMLGKYNPPTATGIADRNT